MDSLESLEENEESLKPPKEMKGVHESKFAMKTPIRRVSMSQEKGIKITYDWINSKVNNITNLNI